MIGIADICDWIMAWVTEMGVWGVTWVTEMDVGASLGLGNDLGGPRLAQPVGGWSVYDAGGDFM